MADPDRPAGEELFEHREPLRRIARRLVLDEHRAEDVVHDAWVAALESSPKLPQVSSAERAGRMRAWLTGVVKNIALNTARRERERPSREHQAAKLEPVELDTERDLDLHGEVVEVLRALREPYKTALYLRYFKDREPLAIARQLGQPVATVKTHLRRGLVMMREELDRRHAARGGRQSWVLGLFALGGPQAFDPLATGLELLRSARPADVTVAALQTPAIGALLSLVAVSGAALGWRALSSDLGRRAPAPVVAVISPEARDAAADRAASRGGDSSREATGTRRAAASGAELPLAAPGQTLTGRVVDPEGRPVAGATIGVTRSFDIDQLLFAKGGQGDAGAQEGPGQSEFVTMQFSHREYECGTQQTATATSAEDGSFCLPLSALAYDALTFASPGFVARVLPVGAQMASECALGDVTLGLGRSLTGTVLDADGEPVPDAVLRLCEGPALRSGLSVYTPAGGGASSAGVVSVATTQLETPGEVVGRTDRAGQFVVRGLGAQSASLQIDSTRGPPLLVAIPAGGPDSSQRDAGQPDSSPPDSQQAAGSPSDSGRPNGAPLPAQRSALVKLGTLRLACDGPVRGRLVDFERARRGLPEGRWSVVAHEPSLMSVAAGSERDGEGFAQGLRSSEFASGEPRSASVDASGSFELTGLVPDADYVLVPRFEGLACGPARLTQGGRSDVELSIAALRTLRLQPVAAEDGAPLSEVEFALHMADGGRQRPITEAGPDGVWAVHLLELLADSAQPPLLVVSAPGREPVEIDPWSSEALGAVALERAALRRVRVLDENGAPLAGATVFLSSPPQLPEAQSGAAAGGSSLAAVPFVVDFEVAGERDRTSSLTDEDGIALVHGPGGPGLPGSTGGARVQLVVQAPGYASFEAHEVLPAGDWTREVQLVPAACVEVRVTDASGTAVGDVAIELSATGGGTQQRRSSDAAGVVRFRGLRPGSFTLRAVEGSRTQPVQLELEAGQWHTLDVLVETRARVAGQLLEEGRPLAGARLSFVPAERGSEPQAQRFVLRDALPWIDLGRGSEFTATTSPTGEYELEGLVPGSYELSIEHASRLLPERRTVTLDPGFGRLDLWLDVASIRGRVFDSLGVAVAGARVSVTEVERSLGRIAARRSAADGPGAALSMDLDDGHGPGQLSDERGAFELRGVPSGCELRLQVSAPGFATLVRKLSVSQGSVHGGADFSLVPGGTLRVQVSDPRGQASAGALLTLIGPAGDSRVALTDETGCALFEDLLPGSWQVEARELGGLLSGDSTQRVVSSVDVVGELSSDCALRLGAQDV